MTSRQLAGSVAAVTGGSRGIGAAIAKRLAQDGAAVALTYVSGQAQAEEIVRSIEAGEVERWHCAPTVPTLRP